MMNKALRTPNVDILLGHSHLTQPNRAFSFVPWKVGMGNWIKLVRRKTQGEHAGLLFHLDLPGFCAQMLAGAALNTLPCFYQTPVGAANAGAG